MRRKTAYSLFALFALAILVCGGVLRYLLAGLPSVRILEEYLPELTTRITDAKGDVITELFSERRVWVPLNEIPIDLQNAFISIEDDRFFRHWGISPEGMIRAAVKNFLAGRVVQGGSTITQQLAKLIFLTQERTFTRKARELLLALQIEHRFSKEEILQMYLNQVYFGQGAYGVSAAARNFFGKKVQELTLPECATLAGIPRLPNYYSPARNPERAKSRRAVVLSRMRELKYISEEEERLAADAPLNVLQGPAHPTIAPYFIEHVRRTLEASFGSDLLYRGGLSIATTLDSQMQGSAEQIMEAALASFDKTFGSQAEAIRAKEKTENLRQSGTVPKDFTVQPSTTIPKVQGALVALDPKTGAIRAMLGGRDFTESQFNRVTQAKRQPGSAFKTFVWTSALADGYTAASVVDDLPAGFYNDGRSWKLLEGATDAFLIEEATRTMRLEADQVWAPKNYDNTNLGPITLRKALAFSRNLVSVRLIYALGPRKVVEWAHKLGIRSPMDSVLSLSLGTSVLTLLEITSAYGTLASEGIRTEPYAITKVTDFDGRTLLENSPKESEAVSPQINYLITNLLRAVITEGTAKSARRLGRPAAGKTGTSQDQRDLWFVGFTPQLVCGAWMGYDDFSPLGKKIAAGGVLVPWWTDFMKKAHENLPERDFTVPEGITFVKIDKKSGFLALPSCPQVILEAFNSGTEPKEFCPLDHSLGVRAEAEPAGIEE
ncbi:MAG: hypothetical protein A2902_00450 [Elusimicrobia bacterium RIFCSPLOWO2_01_FULL_64_13]|nr:MAG: hypothetical protein A2636_00915 [Elusimicrobia bacterium RIFCSPHIGHO2_01_FULL_64_10]OGR97343.1 MAG: hypothetical protein A2902_00450 [Elusimicrobia bacterium RIFCSPLOWO2_01_FULL_64_13]